MQDTQACQYAKHASMQSRQPARKVLEYTKRVSIQVTMSFHVAMQIYRARDLTDSFS